MVKKLSADSCKSFLGFVPDAQSHNVLQRFVTAQGWNTDCAQKGTVENAVEFLGSNPSPEFLLVDVPTAEAASSLLDKLADVCDPKVKVIVTSTVDEYSFFRWLTDIGVHHYLLKPLTEEALENAITATPAQTEPPKSEKQGKLYAVMGTRGGVGASTTSLNIAAAISERHNTPTALLDLEAQWGTISLMLDLEPGRGLRDALSKPDRIDTLFMERVMLKYNENFSILSSEEPLDETITIHPQAAEALIKESRKKFAVTVADLPRDVSAFSQTFLKAADHVVIVTELSLIGLRDAMRLSDFLKEKLGLKRVHFVANRVGMLPKHEMKPVDFEKSLKSKFYAMIPFDLEAYGKMATGEIEATKKRPSAMGNAMLDLANLLHKAPAATPAEAKKPRMLGWMKKGTQ
jgi:pilus assembly protein CpaE